MSHKVLQCHLDLTSLVNKLATVLDLINEGSDHAVAVLDLALALVEKEPDLAPGPGLYIDCHKLFAILLFPSFHLLPCMHQPLVRSFFFVYVLEFCC